MGIPKGHCLRESCKSQALYSICLEFMPDSDYVQMLGRVSKNLPAPVGVELTRTACIGILALCTVCGISVM